MRGHLGVTMSLGEGLIFSSSTKQKLNTKSSTETELIAVDDTMPHILWITYFLECQGYNVGKASICHGNKSAILEQIDNGEVEVNHCGAENYGGKLLHQTSPGKALLQMLESYSKSGR
eukprot:3664415-Ditylum_brightwellii.AAC.1